ncbi:MAG: hypothetical protein KGR26_11155 [Cyanobacteria bacterium REEB65]|nr:hypothetical protein [Cyanobacteria bacterium REEB65]
MKARLLAFNEWLAVKATLVFGTMPTTYLFFFYGFAPLVWPAHQNDFFYWSGTVQLWALPLLMVGQNILGRASEKRAEAQFQMTKDLVAGLQEELRLLRAEHVDVRWIVHQMRSSAASHAQEPTT